MKVVVVGDSGIGKSSFLMRYALNEFPKGYVPIAYDNQSSFQFNNTEDVYLDIWDIIPIEEEPISMRCNRYVGADLILLCFSYNKLSSLYNMVTFWKKELDEHCYNIPVVIVGLCADVLPSIDYNEPFTQSPPPTSDITTTTTTTATTGNNSTTTTDVDEALATNTTHVSPSDTSKYLYKSI